VRAAIGDLDADGRSESRLRGASIFLALLFIGRGFRGLFLRRPPPCGCAAGAGFRGTGSGPGLPS
jgi:hypothetical protein